MKYTIESIGLTLDNHISSQTKWEEGIASDVTLLKQKLIMGNGELPLVEQVHVINGWMGGVNKLIWILVSALVGQLVLGIVAIALLGFHSLGGG